VPMGTGGALGDGTAVERTPACRTHADNERDRRQIEMRTCLKNNLDRILHLCYIVIYHLFIIC
jgi:hypothetical protein